MLYSSTKLDIALHLYRKNGFREVELEKDLEIIHGNFVREAKDRIEHNKITDIIITLPTQQQRVLEALLNLTKENKEITSGKLYDAYKLVSKGDSVTYRRIFDFINGAKKLIRPLNFPPATTPGVGYTIVKVNTVKLAVINLQGNVFMGQNLADPFTTVQPLVEQLREETPNIFIDFHAETTSEKEAMAWYLDGQVSAVVGTHTHVQTSDERVLPNGTAFLSDVGFTGPYNGILGMTRENVIQRFLEQMPQKTMFC